MNNQYKFLLIYSLCTILLAFGAISTSAQILRRGGDLVKQTPVPTAETSVNETVKNLSTVSGVIRWSKMFGLPPTGPTSSEVSPLPCGLMVVVVMKNIGDRGSFGRRQEQLATSFDQVRMSKELKVKETGGIYECSYSISGLPRNVNLTIMARFLDPAYEKNQWIGKWRQTPDFERVFVDTQNVRLTDSRPNAVVNFIMGVSPIPDMPR
jgi:hypothetical protein